MTTIESVTLEVADPTATNRFHAAAFGLGTQVRQRASEEPMAGFRGFTLSLVVSRPATVDGLIGAALDSGATPLKPVSTGTVPSPRTPASPRRAADRTGSRLAAMPAPSPIRTGSPWKPPEQASGARRSRAPRRRSHSQPDPHPAAVLSHPATAHTISTPRGDLP